MFSNGVIQYDFVTGCTSKYIPPLETWTVLDSIVSTVKVSNGVQSMFSNGVTARSERCVERAVAQWKASCQRIARSRLNVNPRSNRFLIGTYPFVLIKASAKSRST